MTHTYVSCGRVTIYQRQQIVINKVQLEDGGEGRERKRERENTFTFSYWLGDVRETFRKKKKKRKRKAKRNEEIL